MKRNIGMYLTGFIAFLLLWQIGYWMMDNHMIPAPWETMSYFSLHIGSILIHTGASSLRILCAVLIALFIGVPVGIIIGMSTKAKKLLDPLLYFVYPIPKVAFLPVFMILFGLGNLSKVLLVVLIVIFQLILSVRDGVADINGNYYKVIGGLTEKKSTVIKYIVFPAVLPRILSGVRISIGIALASLFFAENYATTYGLGYYILSAWTKMNYVEMFSGIMMLGILGMFFYSIIDTIEMKLTPWR